MSFLRSQESNAPSRYALANSQYPELGMYTEKDNANISTSNNDRPTTTTAWLARVFGRNPKVISAKRDSLLPRSGRSSAEMSTTDVESQASSMDASTLLEGADDEKCGGAASSRVSARVVSDAIIGLSDGLTVPFALTAGLSALGNTRVVIFAGMAELTAGAISMGLGGYLGAKSEEESYTQTLSETRSLVSLNSASAASSIKTIFQPYDLPSALTDDLTYHLSKSQAQLTDFLMHFQHLESSPEPSRAITCALTIAAGYFLGGFIPLVPYFLVGKEQVMLALWWSLGVMVVALFAFGYGKTCFVCGWSGNGNVWKGTKGGLQMVVVGGAAAGCAMGLVRLFNGFTT